MVVVGVHASYCIVPCVIGGRRDKTETDRQDRRTETEDRGRDRQRPRDRDKQRQRLRERERDRQTETETDRDRDSDIYRERQTETETERQRHRERHTWRQGQRDTETERETVRDRKRQKETDGISYEAICWLINHINQSVTHITWYHNTMNPRYIFIIYTYDSCISTKGKRNYQPPNTSKANTLLMQEIGPNKL